MLRTALLCLLTLPMFAAATLSGVNLGTYVHGPKVTTEDLKGRVVLFEYWGVNCPPCRASIKHLAEWQSTYDRDTFVIVGNHCQGGTADNTRSVWLANGGGDGISVIDSGDLPGSNVSGIPHCFLFDHEGNLVFDGSPFQVEEHVKKAIENAPGYLVAGYQWSALAREAAALGRQQGMGSALKSVRKHLTDDDQAAKSEATEMMRRVSEWNGKQLAAFTAARSEDPAEAYRIAMTMASKLKGDELADTYSDALKEMKGDKSVTNAIRAADMLGKVKALAESSGLAADPEAWLGRASNRSKAQDIAGGLKTIITKYADTKAAAEAEELAKRWKLTG